MGFSRTKCHYFAIKNPSSLSSIALAPNWASQQGLVETLLRHWKPTFTAPGAHLRRDKSWDVLGSIDRWPVKEEPYCSHLGFLLCAAHGPSFYFGSKVGSLVHITAMSDIDSLCLPRWYKSGINFHPPQSMYSTCLMVLWQIVELEHCNLTKSSMHYLIVSISCHIYLVVQIHESPVLWPCVKPIYLLGQFQNVSCTICKNNPNQDI